MTSSSEVGRTEAAACAGWLGEQLYEQPDQREIFTSRLTVRRRAAKRFPPTRGGYAACPRLTPRAALSIPAKCAPRLLPFAQDLIVEKVQGHWYPEEPHRGCAYRALMSSLLALDPLLLQAAETTGQRGLQEQFGKAFAEAGEVICWVNPGEVKMLKGRAMYPVYSDGTKSDNPYAKMRLNIEPTRLAVKVDVVVPSSPAASAASGGGDYFRPMPMHGHAAASQGSCSSQGQSPTESPMLSWRNPGGNPPSMTPLPPNGMGVGSGGIAGYSMGGSFDGAAMGGGPFDGGMGAQQGQQGAQPQGAQPQGGQQQAGTGASPMRGGGFPSYGVQQGGSYGGPTPGPPVF